MCARERERSRDQEMRVSKGETERETERETVKIPQAHVPLSDLLHRAHNRSQQTCPSKRPV